MSERVVAIYLVDQAYGGPEEGGWWFDCGERYKGFEPIVCGDRDAQHAAFAKCQAFIEEHRMNEGRHEPSSVLCEGWYEPRSFAYRNGAPAFFPERRPTYC